MVSMNTATASKRSRVVPRTHEGAKAKNISALAQLRRVVMANMLWEDQFYIDGKEAGTLVSEAVKNVSGLEAAEVAIYAREEGKLRHVPLLIVREMARNPEQKQFVSGTLARIIQRPDELAEFLLVYDEKYARDAKGKPQPLSAQVKKGLAAAFAKFDEYALAKYDRDSARVKLKDVLFLCHAKPKDGVVGFTKARRRALAEGTAKPGGVLGAGSHLFHKLVMGTMAVPDTWETNLSDGADKGTTFARLIKERKLGALALLRNLRNMRDAGVSPELVNTALKDMSVDRVLPFRFITAARAVPEWEAMIEPAMLKALEGQRKVGGNTAILIDVSGSMDSPLSKKSELTRKDAAAGLAILARELFEDGYMIAFDHNVYAVQPVRGFELRDALRVGGGGTDTALAIRTAAAAVNPGQSRRIAIPGYDRIIIVTDEQTHTSYPDPMEGSRAYVVNVGAYKNGVGYGRWIHVDGFSESTLKFIVALEEAEGVKFGS